MNSLQPTASVDTLRKTGSGICAARYPALAVTEAFLELTLPAGWMLSDGTGCQLDVVRGCLWLTDRRGQDLWLKCGDSERVTTSVLLTAECETVVQLKPVTAPGHIWQQRLQITAKYQHIQLQLTSLSFWQHCRHLLHQNTIFRHLSRSNPDHEQHHSNSRQRSTTECREIHSAAAARQTRTRA